MTGTDPIQVENIRGTIDVGILTIRQDEFSAVLERFRDRRRVLGGKNLYEYA